ncbi:hypothetical protein BJX99DRAFT_238728 [Aspergillus californicus]
MKPKSIGQQVLLSYCDIFRSSFITLLKYVASLAPAIIKAYQCRQKGAIRLANQ